MESRTTDKQIKFNHTRSPCKWKRGLNILVHFYIYWFTKTVMPILCNLCKRINFYISSDLTPSIGITFLVKDV